MWTSTMDLDQKKVLLTQLLGHFYHDIYFSSYSPLQVQNLPRQSLPESSWVRVRNRLSGICGSDIHQLFKGGGDQRVASAATPSQKEFYPGHEVVGEVIEVGDDVQRVHVGDRVALQWHPNCITAGVQSLCHACSTGNYNLCDHGSFLAPQPLGGGWSEEMLLHEQQLFRVPTGLSDEQAVMLEPAAVAMHAVLRHLPHPGERVLIIGAGTVGLITQQIVRALVPQSEISVLARYPFQLEQATRLGAAHIIYPNSAYEGIQKATNAKLYQGIFGNQVLQGGYDVIYDTVGQKTSWFHQSTLHHALRWVRSKGTVVLVGMSQHPIGIDLTPLWNQEISLLGSNSHGVEYWPLDSNEHTSTFRVVSELMQQRRITPEQFITHHFALDNYKHALLTAKNKAESRAIKVVFDYSLLPASVVPNVRASAPRIRRQSTINFMEHSSDEVRRSGEYPLNVPLTPGQKEIPSAQPHTKELARSPKPVRTQEEYDDDDTATALPAIGRRVTGNIRSYVPQSQMQEHVELPNLQQEEVVPAQGPGYDAEDAEDQDMADKTQRISRSQLIPQTETDLHLDSDATTLFSRSSIPLSTDHANEADQEAHEEPVESAHPELVGEDLESVPHPELVGEDLESVPHPELATDVEAEQLAYAQQNEDEHVEATEQDQREVPALESPAISLDSAFPHTIHTEEAAADPMAETPLSTSTEIPPASFDETDVTSEPEEEPVSIAEPQEQAVSYESGHKEEDLVSEQEISMPPADEVLETSSTAPEEETPSNAEPVTAEVDEEGTEIISSADALPQIAEPQTARAQQPRSRTRKKRAGSR
ncbi:hypothetical protein KDA_16900 [Dictyobacter alpinus]|uniref:Enoyl reductase (ER) domain-containing protein n=1 Tax=Dictyobacter alpinus TaxID=2014873 RepID=A0A402B4D5_9CHLR|nr:alcohol dehydrogenase catalytic domain-containing protein [Dictyobacter alpinus]GCE26206.1 hypothetical protein KDA_16900 [Dictyobacter alpinus]